MWLEIACGLIVYTLFKCFFSDGDDVVEAESSDTNALFNVANKLEKLYGGKVYLGLRIPDADTGSRQNIDIVLVNKGQAVVISVKNFSGFISISRDGSWVCEGEGKHKEERHPDPLEETKKQASILESYLEQRGVALPEGYLSYKVVLPNPKLQYVTIHSDYFPPEVITYDQWILLKPEPKGVFSGWVKGAFRSGKKEMQESIHQKLNFTLSTAPMWDRLELKGDKHVLGEFMEFKGEQEDTMALRNIKRSKVSRLIIQKTSMFGLAHSKLQVLYSARDYRSEGASASEWMEETVRSTPKLDYAAENKLCIAVEVIGEELLDGKATIDVCFNSQVKAIDRGGGHCCFIMSVLTCPNSPHKSQPSIFNSQSIALIVLDASWSSIGVLERYDELLSWLIERPDNPVNLFMEWNLKAGMEKRVDLISSSVMRVMRAFLESSDMPMTSWQVISLTGQGGQLPNSFGPPVYWLATPCPDSLAEKVTNSKSYALIASFLLSHFFLILFTIPGSHPFVFNEMAYTNLSFY
ncbi:hypothetical protein DKX38_019837 [Salix brachista]|uniref:NERD domain-containing protein n=1 Tax=Salix brachista TaxID=2182728 RepID=A0A5N5KHL3_9ROSI|nr:hypothetical protein DKX38_019837 [Salix brachista]